MAVYKRGKRWWIEYEHEGKRYRESGGRTKRVAEQALSIRRAEIAQGRFNIQAVKRSPRLQDFAEEYRAWAALNLRSGKDFHGGRLPPIVRALGNYPLNAITSALIERYKQERARDVRPDPIRRGKARTEKRQQVPITISPATVNRELAVLSGMLTKAVEWGKLAVHPMRGGRVKRLPGERHRERVLSCDEETQLLKASGPELRDVIRLALNTGMRLGEICGLTPAEVDLGRGELHLERTKNGRRRRVPLTPAARAILTVRCAGRDACERLFSVAEGRRPWRLDTAFGRACARAGITALRFHDLRHTFATRLSTGGVDLPTIRDLLGHSDLRMTSRYAHPTSASIERALEVLQAWS